MNSKRVEWRKPHEHEEDQPRDELAKMGLMVDGCRNSSNTNEEWCSENDINVKTYYYWQRKVLKAICNELAIAMSARSHNSRCKNI